MEPEKSINCPIDGEAVTGFCSPFSIASAAASKSNLSRARSSSDMMPKGCVERKPPLYLSLRNCSNLSCLAGSSLKVFAFSITPTCDTERQYLVFLKEIDNLVSSKKKFL